MNLRRFAMNINDFLWASQYSATDKGNHGQIHYSILSKTNKYGHSIDS